MSRFSPRLRPLLLAGGLLLAGALSCGREITGPNGGGRAAAIHLDPQFKTIRLVGTGQVLSIGDTVFSGGPVDVTAKPASSGAPTPVALDIGYVGPGSQAASIEITPPSFTGLINQTPGFTAVVRDATSDTVSSFNGVVSLGLAGGTAGANLVGAASVNAVNGVALVTGLPVDRAGTGYRLVASIPALPVVPWTIGAAGVQQVTATVTGVAPATINAAIATGGGTPVLFLGLDTVGIAIGRTRQIPAFLTNPTPTPLTVNLAVRDTTASWNVPSLAIPANGIQALPLLTRAFAGATWAIASSSAGTDSVRVTVDSAIAFIDGYANIQAAIGDTVRTLVMLPEPAGSGGVTLTVTSTDAAAVLVAPGSGRGVSEPICYSCSDLRAAPVGESKLLAPLAGTASITIPPGYLSAELVILPIGQGVSDGFVAAPSRRRST